MDKSYIKERTRRAYDKIGRDYDNWYWMKKSRELRMELTRRVVEILRNEVIAGRKKHPSVLDLCCGTGHLVNELGDVGYTGLDFAPAMVACCRKAYPKKKFVLGDAENLPFRDRSFDAVICFWSFHHIVYPEKVVEEIRRVLRPGGLVLIATFKDVKLNLAARIADWISDSYWGYVTKRYSIGEMERLMQRFKNVKVEVFPKSFSILNMMGIRFLIVSGRR